MLTPRHRLGRYQLVKHLATGGMAEVLLARVAGIEGFERHVVIKKIRDEQARDARFVQMFLDEARLAASLHHHNIVQVNDIGQDHGEYFFAMEYVHGEDLRKLLAHVSDRDGRVPYNFCVTIALNTAAALHYAHEHRGPDRRPLGIVHCDVSPANILVGYDGNVKVVDFGIAKVEQHTTETQSGLMKGKVAYMSPEQCVGSEVDRRSDIFCLGIVLYELVTVRRLFKGANDFLTMASITHGKIPRPSLVRPDLPPELEAIILKALAMDPADRFQTADDMRAALQRFALQANLQTSTPALADYMRQLFGERDVPWLDDEDEPELSIDFDGSGSGIVPAPEAAIHSFAASDGAAIAPDAPIMKARTKAITGAPLPLPLPPPVAAPASAVSSAMPPFGGAPPAPRLARSRSRLLQRPWLYGGIGSVVVFAIVLAGLVASGPPAASTAPAPEAAQPPTASETAVAKPAVTPVPAAAPTPPPPEPVTPEPVVEPAPTPIEPAIDSAATVEKPKQRPRRPRKGVWDPKALLPPTR